MGTNDVILESEVFFVDKEFFGDNEEHCYSVECHNGYAVGTLDEGFDDEVAPKTINIEYPKRAEVMKKKQLVREILVYRGLFDLGPNDLTYGDIMMYLGKIVK